MNKVFVLDRVTERHPDVSKDDARFAWEHVKRSMPRLGTEPPEFVIKHAQTPPQERIKRELGFGRRKS